MNGVVALRMESVGRKSALPMAFSLLSAVAPHMGSVDRNNLLRTFLYDEYSRYPHGEHG